MELSGALWNLYNQGRLPRFAALHKRLLAKNSFHNEFLSRR